MIDIARIREQPDRVRELCRQKNVDAPIDEVLALDEKRRT